jgi:hypothetical protein
MGKALIALLLALMIGCLVAVVRAQPRPVAIRVLMPASFADATAEQVREFNQSQGRLRIKVARGPVDTDAMADLAISSLLLGDTPYDAMLVDISQLTKFVAAGWLEPLEGWFGSDSFEAMVPGARLGNAFDGHIWRLPFTADIGLLYWRTDLMEQPPQTPEQLVAMSQDLQRQGKGALGLHLAGPPVRRPQLRGPGNAGCLRCPLVAARHHGRPRGAHHRRGPRHVGDRQHRIGQSRGRAGRGLARRAGDHGHHAARRWRTTPKPRPWAPLPLATRP